MNGLHRLKVPALFVSLFLQATAVFMLIHVASQQNRQLQKEAFKALQREGSIVAEQQLRLERLICGEGLPAYQWELMTCLLLSITCMSPLLVRRRSPRVMQARGTVYPTEGAFADPAMDGVYHNLKRGLHELETHLKSQPQDAIDKGLLQNVGENIKNLSDRSKSIYDNLVSGHDELLKANNRLNRVMEQSRECSSLSAHTRLDWKKTKPIDSHAQMRQNLDNLIDLSKNLGSLNASTIRLINESLQSDSILHDKIGRAQEHLERIHYSAHNGSKIQDSIFSIIGETRDNISGAHKFVISLVQKWDNLSQLTEQIDEVANQINAQSLAASMEMVRGQNSHTVTDLFPFGNELRILAAQFHTFAHHIKDAIHDGRDELQKTAQYLSQASSKSEHAFVTVNQCGEYLRNSVAAVKYSTSELVLLQQEVNIHMNKLQETYNMGMNTADLVGSLDRSLLNHSHTSRKLLEETGQSALHAEKIATLLTKQFHELNHCQKILAKSAPMLSESMRYATEMKQTISTLEHCVEKAQPKRGDGQVMAVEQKKLGEVQVTCWKISSS